MHDEGIRFFGFATRLRVRHWPVSTAAMLAVGLVLSGCSKSSFDPPERQGPPALVMDTGAPRLWLMLKQEERIERHVGGGNRMIGKWVSETYYHFHLQAHDPQTTERLWKQKMLTMKNDAGGHTAQARIFGQEGEIVWLFLNDQPVAVSSKDGHVLADRHALEERNPMLRDLIPKDLDFYAYDRGLVFTAADARRFKIRPSDFTAEPYTPPNDEYFRNAQFMATRWNGGYATRDFLVRQMMQNGRWVGFFTEKEAADAAKDEFGDKLARPESVFYEWSQTRRTFWTARIGKTREFSEGTHDRLFDLARSSGAPEFLEAGIFVRQGTREPLRLSNPDGFLVLHRTRLGEDGRLEFTNLHPQWTATLPFHELHNRSEFSDHLLLYGSVQRTEKGVTNWSEHLVALNLSDGQLKSWNVPLEKRNE